MSREEGAHGGCQSIDRWHVLQRDFKTHLGLSSVQATDKKRPGTLSGPAAGGTRDGGSGALYTTDSAEVKVIGLTKAQ